MKSFGLYSILEYILSTVLILVEVLILANYYYSHLESEMNFSQYTFFMNELYFERFLYCLYKATGNPYYLFYIPSYLIPTGGNALITNSEVSSFSDNFDNIMNNNISYLDSCFSPISFSLVYILNITNSSSSLYNITFENINISTVPTFIIQYAYNRAIIDLGVYNDEIGQILTGSSNWDSNAIQDLSNVLNISNFEENISSYFSKYLYEHIFSSSQIGLSNQIANQLIQENQQAIGTAIGIINGTIKGSNTLVPIFSPNILISDTNNNLYIISVYQFGSISAKQSIYPNLNSTELQQIAQQELSSNGNSGGNANNILNGICSYL